MSSDSQKPKGPAGWNDPPMFSYDSQVHGVQSTKLNLTKRVSFPLSSGTSPSQPMSASSGPPLGLPSGSSPCLSGPPINTLLHGPLIPNMPPSLIPTKESSNSLPNIGGLLSEVNFSHVSENLESQIEDINKLNEKTGSDIKKKIKLLESMWNDNKFDPQLKLKILELTQAIKDRDIKLGLELQRSLMVDHASLCSSWIPALRHLLNSLKPADEPQSPS